VLALRLDSSLASVCALTNFRKKSGPHGKAGPTRKTSSNIAGRGPKEQRSGLRNIELGCKGKNTEGLGVQVLAERDLQCVIFAGSRAY